MPDSTPSSFAATVLDQVKNVSIVGLLTIILYASYSRDWVWGTEYAKLERDRDEWKAIAMKAAKIVDEHPTFGDPPPSVESLRRSIDSKLEGHR